MREFPHYFAVVAYGKDVAYIESLKDGAKFQAHLKGVTGRDDVIVKEVRFQSEWRYVVKVVF